MFEFHCECSKPLVAEQLACVIVPATASPPSTGVSLRITRLMLNLVFDSKES
jgi:hypothetical protein